MTQRQRLTCQSRTCACIEKQSCPDVMIKDLYATQQVGEQQIIVKLDQLTGSKCAASPKLTQTAACALVCRPQQNLIDQIPSKTPERNETRRVHARRRLPQLFSRSDTTFSQSQCVYPPSLTLSVTIRRTSATAGGALRFADISRPADE